MVGPTNGDGVDGRRRGPQVQQGARSGGFGVGFGKLACRLRLTLGATAKLLVSFTASHKNSDVFCGTRA